jgi:hypothetical protein
MRRIVVILGLSLMAVGLLLTTFGTRQTTQMTTVYNINIEPYSPIITTTSQIPSGTHYDFTLNYVGGALAILGTVGFAFSYPLTRSDVIRSFSTQASL